MAERALNDLYALMGDQQVGMRVRLNAAISASRVERLAMPGEEQPPAVAFLRRIIDYKRDGVQYSSAWRRESASALAYYERRAKKAELTYEVPDQTERAAGWRRVINGTLRASDPQRAPLDHNDTFELPPGDPERTLAALLLPVSGTSARRRQRAVDDPGGVQPITTEAERLALLEPIADIVEARLKAIANTDLRRTQTE